MAAPCGVTAARWWNRNCPKDPPESKRVKVDFKGSAHFKQSQMDLLTAIKTFK